MASKKCIFCKVTKPINAFYRESGKTYRENICEPCFTKINYRPKLVDSSTQTPDIISRLNEEINLLTTLLDEKNKQFHEYEQELSRLRQSPALFCEKKESDEELIAKFNKMTKQQLKQHKYGSVTRRIDTLTNQLYKRGITQDDIKQYQTNNLTINDPKVVDKLNQLIRKQKELSIIDSIYNQKK